MGANGILYNFEDLSTIKWMNEYPPGSCGVLLP